MIILLLIFQKQIKLKEQLLIPGSGKYIIQPISINDVCKIAFILQSIHQKFSLNKIIDLVGPEQNSHFKQFFREFCL